MRHHQYTIFIIFVMIIGHSQSGFSFQLPWPGESVPDEFFAAKPPAAGASAPFQYGITADWPLYRSQFIRFYPNGDMRSNDHFQGQNSSGIYSLITNVKGICEVSGTGTAYDGRYFITTGLFNSDSYFDDKLLEIDPLSSSVNVLGTPLLSTTTPGKGPIRDICFISSYPGIQQGIYGIRDGIELVRLNFNGSFSPPISLGVFTPTLPLGSVARGLSWTLCSGTPELHITVTGAANQIQHYKCDPNTATLTLIGNILPTPPAIFSQANCGIGWIKSANELWVNGVDNTYPAAVYKFSQNIVPTWCPGLSTSTTATNVPASGRNIEDFCTELY